MDIEKKGKAPLPEKTILGILASELRRDLTSPRRKETLVTMIRSLSLFFRDVGRPQKWIIEIKRRSIVTKKRKEREPRVHVPRNAEKLVTALLELSKHEQSSELAFWTVEELSEVNATLNGNLIKYLTDQERDSTMRGVFSLASKHLEKLLVTREIDAIQAVIRFVGKIPGFQALFDDELKRIRKSSLAKLPEVSRQFLTEGDTPDATRSVQISDPSQSVEIRQFAHLLQSSWIRFHERGLDASTYDSIRAFGKGFKNLDFVGSFGEEVRFSEEHFEGEALQAGEIVAVQVPAVAWRYGDRLRIIVKGKVKPKS